MPDVDNINFIERVNSNFQKNINVIFKCKNDCKTIFTNGHVKEMLRFTAWATDDPLWQQLCYRESKETVVFIADGFGCSDKAYLNLTKYVELNVQMGIIDDQMIQAQINNTAQHINELPEIRQLMHKDFTQDHPYTNFLVSQLQISGSPIFESVFKKTSETQFTEVPVRKYSESEVILMQNKLTENVF